MKKYLVIILTLVALQPIFAVSEPQKTKPFNRYKLMYTSPDKWGQIFVSPDMIKHTSLEKDSSLYIIIKGVKYRFTFDTDPSDDPHFIIEYSDPKKGWLTLEEQLSGETLYINSSGFIYLVSSTFYTFERYLKWELSKSGITEIIQPFYYVGKVCELNANATLYLKPDKDSPLVAGISQGMKVEILLSQSKSSYSDDAWFLVVTPFGLSGWLSVDVGNISRPGTPFGCIRYYGD